MNIIRISLVCSLALTLSTPLQAMRRGFFLSPAERAARLSRSERAASTSRQKQQASSSEGTSAANEQQTPAQQQQQQIGDRRIGIISKDTKFALQTFDIDAPMPGLKDESRVLHAAAGSGMLDRIRKYMARGATIDIKNKNGMTPLVAAMASGQSQAACLLLELGANPNQATSIGLMPLDLAETFGLESVVAALKEHGGKKTDLPDDAFRGVLVTPATMETVKSLDPAKQDEWRQLFDAFCQNKNNDTLFSLLTFARKHNIPYYDEKAEQE